MAVFRIKMMNAISPEGLGLLADNFQISAGEQAPQGILVRSARVDVDDYPSLLAVARAGSGINTITVDKATEKGICVFNTPGANANAVVDLVFPMIGVWMRHIFQGIEFCRSLVDYDPDQLSAEVERRKSAFRGVEIAGKTLGVVGLGQIGVRLANGGVHRQMKVKGFDPMPGLDNIHQLLPEVDIARTLKGAVGDADIVSLHLPLTPGTKHLVNADFLRKMKKGAILVNYARGPIVDEQAVIETLNSDYLAGYITDFPTAATIGHPKVLTTPHLGASTSESEENCARMAVRELSAYLDYGNVANSVNFPNIESTPSAKVHSRLIVINRDVPGMIAFATNVISGYGINIASYLNESNGRIGYNIIDVESDIPAGLLQDIEKDGNVIRTRLIRLVEERG
ncbi:MAG: phosphoglycerate dehydrogenase [Desulfocapsaceae bacterium]|nr:phosphoglycerate dehydrogenase [Desulfocapsaceae bacterium]